MDNGAEVVDGLQLREKMTVEEGVSGDRVKEIAVAGSHVLKDSQSEDVFEEVIGDHENLLEQWLEPDLRLGSANEEGKLEMNDDSGRNPDSVYENEKFEEAVETPRLLQNEGEEKPDMTADEVKGDLVEGTTVYKAAAAIVIDEGGTGKEAAESELEILTISKEDMVTGVSHIVAGGEIEPLKEDQVELNSDSVIRQSENGDTNATTLEQVPEDEKHENGGADDSSKDMFCIPGVAESSLEIAYESTNEKKFNEILLSKDNDGGESMKIINASGDYHPEIQEDESSEPTHKFDKCDTERWNDVAGEVKVAMVDSGPTNDNDEDVDLMSSSTDRPTDNQEGRSYLLAASTGLDSEHCGESHEWKSISDNGQKGVDERSVERDNGVPSYSDSSDDEIGELKDASIELKTEDRGETCEPEGVPANLHEDMDKRAVERGYDSPACSAEIKNEKTEKINDSGGDLTAVDFKSNLHQNPDSSLNSGSASEEPKKRDGDQGKQIHQVNRDPEIRPPSEPPSTSARSTNPTVPPAQPAGLGRAAPLLEPAPRAAPQTRVNGSVSHMQTQQVEDPANGEAEENDETREKLQMIRVKFLRLAHRLGQTPHNVVVAQVLYRLGLAEQLRGRNGGRVGAFSFDRASAMAEQLEAAGQEPLDFSCTIMVLGKTGVGKSATINSIFDEVKFCTDAFHVGTKKVQDVVGTVQGIKVRVIDTPGLLPSWSDQRKNEKILLTVKRFIKQTPPDIVLYLDRLDMQTRDFSDMPLLRTITETFGPSIWFNAIVVLTHAASAPPEGPNGTASSYDMFVTQRSHVVQQAIRQAAGDMRLMNPVSLVENHSACRTNRAGQRVLPNGQVWKPHLLLLSFASKILAEANTLLKLQDNPPGRPSATRSRAPPLPFLLSSLLQSRPQVRLPDEQFGDEDGLEEEFDESSDSENESEYDELPPFRRLTKAQVAQLSKAQKKAYFDELEYREKLFMKKQLKEEKKRRKMMKKIAAEAKELPSDYGENAEEESGGAASVPVPMPDLTLPASFDSDNPTHRYRSLDSSNQWLVRPVLETHVWDHDVGYEGINVEKMFVIKGKVPVSFSGQVTKDKKDANVQMEMASSIKHGEGKATSLGFDMQTVGKDLAYTMRSETIFSNFRRNKATAGLSVTLLGDAVSAGMKVEDKLIANKRFRMVVTCGAMTGRGDVAYGGSLEAQLRDKDHPLGRSLSTFGLSVMDWHGDLAIGGNIQTQIPIGRSTNLIGRANLNNRGAGQVSIRLNSSEQLQIALIGFIPLLRKLVGYSQQLHFGQG